MEVPACWADCGDSGQRCLKPTCPQILHDRRMKVTFPHSGGPSTRESCTRTPSPVCLGLKGQGKSSLVSGASSAREHDLGASQGASILSESEDGMGSPHRFGHVVVTRMDSSLSAAPAPSLGARAAICAGVSRPASFLFCEELS